MSNVTRADISDLHSTDPASFALWLSGGLNTLHGSSAVTASDGLSGFGNARIFVGVSDDLTDDLRDIHDCLNPAEQGAFRAGLARALSDTVHLAPTLATIRIVNTLLILAQWTAAAEVIDVLPGLACRCMRWPPTNEKDEVLDRILRTASAVATPGRRSVDCLHAIIGLGGFRPKLAYPALIALCGADPAGIGDHLVRLHPHLDEAFGDRTDGPSLRREVDRLDLIAEVFGLVPREAFFRATSGEPEAFRNVAVPESWMRFSQWWRDASFEIARVSEAYIKLRNTGVLSEKEPFINRAHTEIPTDCDGDNTNPNTVTQPQQLDPTDTAIELARLRR